MFARILPSRLLTGALVLLAVMGGSAATLLHAQEATATPAAGQGMVTPASGELTGGEAPTVVPAAAPAAGPRATPPLERYRANLPGDDRAENTAVAARGGRHTIVLSTLALVLIVVVVVLLAVD